MCDVAFRYRNLSLHLSASINHKGSRLSPLGSEVVVSVVTQAFHVLFVLRLFFHLVDLSNHTLVVLDDLSPSRKLFVQLSKLASSPFSCRRVSVVSFPLSLVSELHWDLNTVSVQLVPYSSQFLLVAPVPYFVVSTCWSPYSVSPMIHCTFPVYHNTAYSQLSMSCNCSGIFLLLLPRCLLFQACVILDKWTWLVPLLHCIAVQPMLQTLCVLSSPPWHSQWFANFPHLVPA